MSVLPVPQDPDAPPRGYDLDGRPCDCPCHSNSRMSHIMACCRSEPPSSVMHEKLKPFDWSTIDD